jgi:hypothetical protein
LAGTRGLAESIDDALVACGRTVRRQCFGSSTEDLSDGVRQLEFGADCWQRPVDRLDATASQVASVFGISTSAAYAKLGNTRMIGQNDSAGEIFTLADANTLGDLLGL